MFCLIGLGLLSMLVAVLFPDIIGLLLFTYHIWAPGIIVPVVVGVLSPRRDAAQNRAVLVTMVLSVVAALLWRLTPWSSTLDPAVAGVLVSMLIYALLQGWRRPA